MNNKEQKIKYIKDRWCDSVNDSYLAEGWHVVSIYPAASKDNIGAYVLLERTKPYIPYHEYPID